MLKSQKHTDAVFNLNAVHTSADIPKAALPVIQEELRGTFGHLQFGDLPDPQGIVRVGKVVPLEKLHSGVMKGLRRFAGESLVQISVGG
ncbi:MAG: hypothetical protein A3C06_02685 [Candidatus Taylorbacteria bacterium RIFCSPHIGHO2_02_FULL_46_13]|uniref:Uncharacterized protein n=1 Tax=Candidatus Taylorbacteria bacterium RIFCSPHIGHO2_02_FULL_46_13 TaxID=1802312 RepID=A0A1G2MT90_9BACT|nr:MAG: hypothetical protein A3C06_02685 [Candidatus Taylorbacteria bacterium RIFCSPHIGHO2_02_FULL_46_13]